MSTTSKALHGLATVIRVIGIVAGLLLGVLGGFIVFKSKTGLNSKAILFSAISGFYCVVFCFLIIIAELRPKFIIKYFLFLNTFLGRGVFYLFAGLLTFPIPFTEYDWVIEVTGFTLVSIGLLNIVLIFFHCGKQPEPVTIEEIPEGESQPILASKTSV
eukprot:TRINITY_DN4873_c0_g1_i1.p1 TRINITY_DN4873_c0_g1~~TRINITY_DN4873_c0_g1_i1.p1  ORF type:complete len:159 (+),score=28.82 TRINITY_DN4873_c0_g1_i1:259-735(+)